MFEGEAVLIAGGLMAIALLASLVAAQIRVPGLVLFLGIGMLVGSDALGWVDFSDYELERDVGVLAIALIIFEGGLAAGFSEIRPVLRPAIALAVLGTIATAVVTGFAAAWLFDLSILEGMLLGSIVASTDAAAIFAVLRGSTLRRRLARTLEGEAGFNDPVAALLVLGFIDWIQDPGYGVVDMAGSMALELGIGLAAGLAVGWASVWAFKTLKFGSSGLYPVASITAAALAFGLAEVAHGSGFLSVYLTGLMLGSARIPAKRSIVTFHEGLAWVAQLITFLTLGLLVFPSALPDVAVEGTILALVLAVVARPLATYLATVGAGFTLAERTALGWAGLRGAIPVVFATFPVIAGVGQGTQIFNIVFFAVLVSTVLQGTTFEYVARALRVTTSRPALPKPLTETGTIRALGAEVVEYPVAADDAAVGARVRDLGLPRDALVNVIIRDDRALLPRGSTRIEAHDSIHMVISQDVAGELEGLLYRWHHGPVGPTPRPRPRLRGGLPVYTVRRWEEGDGDPAHPRGVLGIPVVDQLRSRQDRPGALLVLDDGRYAVSGPLLAVGSATQVQAHARKRAGLASSDAERAWWQEVIGALAV
ncbi:MAG: potassium/proton antiporter [Solirubrobacterales bacterium]